MANLAMEPKKANVGQKGNLTLIGGFDIGNGYIKFCSQDNRVRFPSYLESCYYRPTDVPPQGLVGVIGPSGSGKSSVVYAGLIPQLRKSGSWLI
jgi:ABC-type multidrug transport system fused ATPase/permease subunit